MRDNSLYILILYFDSIFWFNKESPTGEPSDTEMLWERHVDVIGKKMKKCDKNDKNGHFLPQFTRVLL